MSQPLRDSQGLNSSSTNLHKSGKQDSSALKELTGLSSAEFRAVAPVQHRGTSAEQAYARTFNADVPTLRVACIFTAQACQKMFLQEATRYGTKMQALFEHQLVLRRVEPLTTPSQRRYRDALCLICINRSFLHNICLTCFNRHH